MDYNKHYNNLINRAKNRKNLEGYKETHHIVPKCMGGTEDPSNLVELTAEEHFVAHRLLVKMFPDNRSIICALSVMTGVSKKHKHNRSPCKMYAWIKETIKSRNAGENNPRAKLTNAQVLEIYYSTDTIADLAVRYNVSRYNIITVKRKIYYRNVTKDISELPGCSDTDLYGTGGGFPLPIDLIEDVFYDTGDYNYFWEKYRLTSTAVKGIKSKKTFKKITSKLGTPGQIKRYGLTRDMIELIFNSEGTNCEIAEKFGIHYNTVRNIKGKHSRAYNMWEDF